MSEEHDKKTITIKKVSLWKGISAVFAILLVISIFTGGFGKNSNRGGTEQIKEAQPAQPRGGSPSPGVPSLDMKALIDDDDVKGKSNAPVTIVEWSDFECPFCTRFYEQTLGQIIREYVDTGKVKFVYRDFPLGFHANAQKAAESAECAGEQGKFWEMHDMLFEKGVSGGVSSFKQFAKDIGLNTGKFDDCLDSGKMASEVAKDMRDGQSAGIGGTPGFIINGRLVSGAQPFSAFKQVIDAELAK
ncbi:disulfide bond formation protein DsbA [archaeon]|nr:disulfide bond formation protein DsbA [archaeon]|tara:strand:- start:1007 stop:1741 length:735 start_codon:yes stop_codon:yes gene_type:complete